MENYPTFLNAQSKSSLKIGDAGQLIARLSGLERLSVQTNDNNKSAKVISFGMGTVAQRAAA